MTIETAGLVREGTKEGLARALASPLFIVGAGRSGTTWLQIMLGQHPAVATTTETYLFAGYLSWMERRWRLERQHREHGGRTGIAHLLDEEEFYALLRGLACDVLTRVIAGRAGVALLVEKTPNHAHHAQLILRLFPNARFVHLVRDPRAVVASMAAAARSWGSRWAPAGAAAAAKTWRRAVVAAKGIGAHTAGFRELRYEDLLADPAAVLEALFGWLGVRATRRECADIVEQTRIDRLRAGDNRVAASVTGTTDFGSFYRAGAADSWKQTLSRRQVRIVEHVAGELMDVYGYAPCTRRTRGRPLELFAHDALEGLKWRVPALLDRVLERL